MTPDMAGTHITGEGLIFLPFKHITNIKIIQPFLIKAFSCLLSKYESFHMSYLSLYVGNNLVKYELTEPIELVSAVRSCIVLQMHSMMPPDSQGNFKRPLANQDCSLPDYVMSTLF